MVKRMVVERLYIDSGNAMLMREAVEQNKPVTLSFSAAELHSSGRIGKLTPLVLDAKQAAAVKMARDRDMDLQLRMTPMQIIGQRGAGFGDFMKSLAMGALTGAVSGGIGHFTGGGMPVRRVSYIPQTVNLTSGLDGGALRVAKVKLTDSQKDKVRKSKGGVSLRLDKDALKGKSDTILVNGYQEKHIRAARRKGTGAEVAIPHKRRVKLGGAINF
jgi:hypothetical protein